MYKYEDCIDMNLGGVVSNLVSVNSDPDVSGNNFYGFPKQF